MESKERPKTIRKEQGYTQKDVYTALGLSANCYASREQGRTEPSIRDICRLCAFCNVSADYLLGMSDIYLDLPSVRRTAVLLRSHAVVAHGQYCYPLADMI